MTELTIREQLEADLVLFETAKHEHGFQRRYFTPYGLETISDCLTGLPPEMDSEDVAVAYKVAVLRGWTTQGNQAAEMVACDSRCPDECVANLVRSSVWAARYVLRERTAPFGPSALAEYERRVVDGSLTAFGFDLLAAKVEQAVSVSRA